MLARPGASLARERAALLIYYTAETTPAAIASDNYQRLIATLGGSVHPAARRALQSLHEEQAAFPAMVERDLAAIEHAADRLDLDVAIFSNALALRGKARLRDAAGWREIEWRTPAGLPDPVLEYWPLARASSLAAALESVARSFPRSGPVILILKSHGDESMAVMPRVVADLSDGARPVDLLAHLEGRSAATGPARWAVPKGIGKAELFGIIEEAARRHGSAFDIVVLDACRSGLLDLASYRAVPAAVGTLVHSGRADIAFGQLDYSRALNAARTSSEVPSALAAGLLRDGLQVEDRTDRDLGTVLMALRAIPLWFYFMPLAVWLAWIVIPRLQTPRDR